MEQLSFSASGRSEGQTTSHRDAPEQRGEKDNWRRWFLLCVSRAPLRVTSPPSWDSLRPHRANWRPPIMSKWKYCLRLRTGRHFAQTKAPQSELSAGSSRRLRNFQTRASKWPSSFFPTGRPMVAKCVIYWHAGRPLSQLFSSFFSLSLSLSLLPKLNVDPKWNSNSK